MNEFEFFWQCKGAWPRDPSSYVFLGRAFQSTGRAMYGNEWTGNEGGSRPPDLLPDVLSSRNEAADLVARALLNHHVPEFVERMVNVENQNRLFEAKRSRYEKVLVSARAMKASMSSNRKVAEPVPPTPPVQTAALTELEWQQAKELNQKDYDAAMPAWTRGHAVRLAMIAACESGRLVAAYRPKPGGSMVSIPPEWWNADQAALSNFNLCSLPPDDPYRRKSDRGEHSWIFLTAESLDRFLVQQPHSDIQSKFQFHLSPYLRAMISVAKKMKITPLNQPKKEEVKAELEKAWALPDPLSANMLEAMATALREPASQLGRAAKNPAKKSA